MRGHAGFKEIVRDYCENVRSGKSWLLDYIQTEGEVRKKKKKNGGESGRRDRAS